MRSEQTDEGNYTCFDTRKQKREHNLHHSPFSLCHPSSIQPSSIAVWTRLLQNPSLISERGCPCKTKRNPFWSSLSSHHRPDIVKTHARGECQKRRHKTNKQMKTTPRYFCALCADKPLLKTVTKSRQPLPSLMQDFCAARFRRDRCKCNATKKRSLAHSSHYSFRPDFYSSSLTHPESRLRLNSRLVRSLQGGPTVTTIKPASVHIRAAQQHRP